MNCNEILKSGIWKLIFSLNVKENESSKKLSRRVFMEIPKFLKNSVQKKQKNYSNFCAFQCKNVHLFEKIKSQISKKKKVHQDFKIFLPRLTNPLLK